MSPVSTKFAALPCSSTRQYLKILPCMQNPGKNQERKGGESELTVWIRKEEMLVIRRERKKHVRGNTGGVVG